MEAGRELNWTVIDAIYGVQTAWSKVTPATINSCFIHCGFMAPTSAFALWMMMTLMKTSLLSR